MIRKTPIFLLASFILGIATNSLFVSLRSEDTINSIDLDTKGDTVSEQSSQPLLHSLEQRMNTLEQQFDRVEYSIGAVNSKLDDLLVGLDEAEVLHQISENSTEHTLVINTSTNMPLSAENIKQKIYADALDSTKSLPDILDSVEMRSLPAAEKNEVLTELARRLDSGEIDKTQFLPGYK